MLNDLKIKQLKAKEKIYRKADHSGLCIEVRPTGGKYWRWRYRYLNKPKMLNIGQYPAISLSYARMKTLEYREQLAKGNDPAAILRDERIAAIQANNDIFSAVATECFDLKKAVKSVAWYDNRLRYLRLDINPVIGKKPIKDVDSADIKVIIDNTIKRIRKTNRGTGEVKATLVRQIVGEVMQYAIISKRIKVDPTFALRRYIERPDVEHAQPVDKADRPKIMPAIEKYQGSISTANALRTLMYSMLRSIEVRRGKKAYINFEERTWTIPVATKAEILAGKRNMKKNRMHIVPLSDQLIEILKIQFETYPDSEYIFPGDDGFEMMGKNTLNTAFDYMGLGHISMHDFRATASTELNEANFNSDWVEIQLAHVKGDKTRASYDHAKWLNDRRRMLQWWADYVDSWVQTTEGETVELPVAC